MIKLNYQPTQGDCMQLQSLLNIVSHLKHGKSIKAVIHDRIKNVLKSVSNYLIKNASEIIGMIITSILVFFVTFVVITMEISHLEKTDPSSKNGVSSAHSK